MAFASPGRSPSSRSAVPAFTPDELHGEWDTIMLATKAHHTETAVRRFCRTYATDGCVVSAQNGLNELEIARVVGAERTVGAFVNFGADYIEPGVIHYGGRGAVVVGEIDGRVTARVNADSRRVAVVRRRARSSRRTSGVSSGARRRTARCCSRRR